MIESGRYFIQKVGSLQLSDDRKSSKSRPADWPYSLWLFYFCFVTANCKL